MLRRFRGNLDEGSREFVRGWAASGRRPLDVTVCVRGQRFTVPPNADRPDLASLGLPRRSGFMFIFPEPLTQGDAVQVLFPNGREIQGSPFVYSEQDLSTIISGGSSNTFSNTFPTHQNAIDIFRGVWVSEMPEKSGLQSGGVAALFDDGRPHWAESVLGSFQGKSILELGPFEAHVSSRLE